MLRQRYILVATIVVVGLIWGWIYHESYNLNLMELRRIAKQTFIEALNTEMNNRNIPKEPILSNATPKSLLKPEYPDSVFIVDKTGKYYYKFYIEKHNNSTTDDIELRALQSSVFENNPIQPDSLHHIWKRLLLKENIFLQSALQISVLDRHHETTVIMTTNSTWCNRIPPVFITYIGYAFEIEAIGFINYSIWSILGWWILVYLLSYVLSVLAVYATVSYIQNKIRSLCSVKIKEVHVPVFVKESDGFQVNSYALRDNFIFYAEQRIIEVNGKKKKMPLQACLLLELFLNSKNYIVTYDEIINKLWPDGSGHIRRMHKAVARLRNYLAIECPILIERENADSYQLLV